MEQLIVFLFKNWILVIIAVTFFYQLRNRRKKREEGNPSKPRTGMPTFGNASSDARRPLEARPVKVGQPSLRTETEPVRDEFRQSGFVKPDAPSSKQKTSPYSAQTTKQAVATSPIYADEISSTVSSLQDPKREQVLQGIVWAEILGPPRSKKPFRR